LVLFQVEFGQMKRGVVELGSKAWALITWLVFATCYMRITKGWEGKRTAILGGHRFFVDIWICYLE
jgi:ABC-type transport system involved in cytochrome c biogenesis permease subunit